MGALLCNQISQALLKATEVENQLGTKLFLRNFYSENCKLKKKSLFDVFNGSIVGTVGCQSYFNSF